MSKTKDIHEIIKRSVKPGDPLILKFRKRRETRRLFTGSFRSVSIVTVHDWFRVTRVKCLIKNSSHIYLPLDYPEPVIFSNIQNHNALSSRKPPHHAFRSTNKTVWMAVMHKCTHDKHTFDIGDILGVKTTSLWRRFELSIRRRASRRSDATSTVDVILNSSSKLINLPEQFLKCHCRVCDSPKITSESYKQLSTIMAQEKVPFLLTVPFDPFKRRISIDFSDNRNQYLEKVLVEGTEQFNVFVVSNISNNKLSTLVVPEEVSVMVEELPRDTISMDNDTSYYDITQNELESIKRDVTSQIVNIENVEEVTEIFIRNIGNEQQQQEQKKQEQQKQEQQQQHQKQHEKHHEQQEDMFSDNISSSNEILSEIQMKYSFKYTTQIKKKRRRSTPSDAKYHQTNTHSLSYSSATTRNIHENETSESDLSDHEENLYTQATSPLEENASCSNHCSRNEYLLPLSQFVKDLSLTSSFPSDYHPSNESKKPLIETPSSSDLYKPTQNINSYTEDQFLTKENLNKSFLLSDNTTPSGDTSSVRAIRSSIGKRESGFNVNQEKPPIPIKTIPTPVKTIHNKKLLSDDTPKTKILNLAIRDTSKTSTDKMNTNTQCNTTFSDYQTNYRSTKTKSSPRVTSKSSSAGKYQSIRPYSMSEEPLLPQSPTSTEEENDNDQNWMSRASHVFSPRKTQKTQQYKNENNDTNDQVIVDCSSATKSRFKTNSKSNSSQEKKQNIQDFIRKQPRPHSQSLAPLITAFDNEQNIETAVGGYHLIAKTTAPEESKINYSRSKNKSVSSRISFFEQSKQSESNQ